MPDVQEIEAAVGQNDPLPTTAQFGQFSNQAPPLTQGIRALEGHQNPDLPRRVEGGLEASASSSWG